MKKLQFVSLLILFVLFLFAGCRSTKDSVDLISSKDLKPIAVEETHQDDVPSVITLPAYEITTEKEAEIINADSIILDSNQDGTIVVEHVDNISDVNTAPKASSYVSTTPQIEGSVNPGLIILAIVGVIACLSCIYYLFIFRKKVSK